MRGNNPGNLRRWGTYPVQNGFVVFPSLTKGLEAMRDELRLYQQRGIRTIQGIVKVWAPSKDNNNVSAYIQTVVQKSGYGEHQVLDMQDPVQSGRVMYGMICQEQGGFPLSANLLRVVVGMQPGQPLTSTPEPAFTQQPAPAKPAPAAPAAAAPAPAPAPEPKQAPAATGGPSTVAKAPLGATVHPPQPPLGPKQPAAESEADKLNDAELERIRHPT